MTAGMVVLVLLPLILCYVLFYLFLVLTRLSCNIEFKT
jgi:hypothetical protein